MIEGASLMWALSSLLLLGAGTSLSDPIAVAAPPAEEHPPPGPMSCYACTTMDYENQVNNLCRFIETHPKPPMSAPPLSHAQLTSTARPEEDPASSTQQLQYLNESLSAAHSAVSHMGHTGGRLISASAPEANFLRTRQCHEGEHYCSIVSVVRIEFANEKLSSRFWALERNCSRSCNTGCMLIGERIRLRVCSKCCRSPNCNVGSNAHSATRDAGSPLMGLLACLTVLLLTTRLGLRLDLASS